MRLPLSLLRVPARHFLGKRDGSSKTQSLVPSENPNSNKPTPESIQALTNLRAELAHRQPLPPKSGDKLTVFLEPEGVLFHTWVPHKTEAYYNKPIRPADFEFDIPINDEEVPILLYMRPHWQALLEYLRENCETVIYTTLQAYYLEMVLDKIGNTHFEFVAGRLSQDDCGLFKSDFDGVEELSKVISGLDRPLERSVLVDHNPFCYFSEPSNAVPILEYEPSNDPKMTDRKALELIQILRQLQHLPDVRPALQKRYGIEGMVGELNFT